MSAHPPPVPPAQQPKHEAHRERTDASDKAGGAKGGGAKDNTGEQGETANVK